MEVGDVVQFNLSHSWGGCLGIILDKKKTEDDLIYLIEVPLPNWRIARIFSSESSCEIKYIGKAEFILNKK